MGRVETLKHSSLGIHSNNLEDFGSSQTPSLVSLPKSSKNIESHTANIRMLGESLDFSKVESLDSRNFTDSTLCVESNKINSVCGTHPLKASSGERESVREGEGSELRVCLQLRGKSRSKIQAPSPSHKNGSLENGSLVEDSKELGDSSKEAFLDSKNYNVESKLAFKNYNPLKGLDSTLDSTKPLESSLDSTDSTNFIYIY